MKWICRETVFYRDNLYKPGDSIDVDAEFGYELSGGMWSPVGMELIDPRLNLQIPRQFEPEGSSVLVRSSDLLFARSPEASAMKPAKWKLMVGLSELEEALKAEQENAKVEPVKPNPEPDPKPDWAVAKRSRGRSEL